jgi:electron transport complex protein RnfG
MKESARSGLGAALRLLAFTAVTAAVLAAMVAATRERIAAGERRAQLEQLAALLPESGYDNDPIADRTRLVAPEGLGDAKPRTIWRARRGGVPAAAVLSVVAPDGYAGPIELLVGVDAAGTVLGVRVVAHRETPGLGDPIEEARSEWIHGFDGRALGDPPAAGWAVRRDGGQFDQFAGATISPRAVVGAVRRALEWYAAHHGEVFDAPAIAEDER